MIITKQRMAGYTPLRERGTAGSAAHPAPQPTATLSPAPVTTTPVIAAVPEPRQPAVAPAAVTPVATTTVAPTEAADPVQSGIDKQRMAGYTPLRLRDGPHPATVLQAVSAAPVLTTPGVAAVVPIASSAPPAAPAPAVAVEPASTEQQMAPLPKNRMQGYTPLRQRANTMSVTPTPASALPTPVAAPATPPVTPTPAPAESTVAIASPPAPQPALQPKMPKTPAAARHAAEKKAAPRWLRPALFVGGAVVLALLVVLAARGLRSLESVQAFIATYDGHSTMPDSAPSGMPRWMGWQHFLNMFFLVLIIRTGIQIRHEKRPAAMWTPKENSFYSPKNNTPKKVSITTWMHQSLDVLWILNGLVFVILLAVTGHWMRVVPTSWDIFPNMASVALQYASFDWPTENGWIHYNALQMVSYFLIIYVAAPLAVLTGLRMSSWWPGNATTLNKIYPVELARKFHFPVMLFFTFFVIAHVFLVFTTGALRNLNHMYTSRDVTDFWGLAVLLVSVGVTALAWVLLRPTLVIPLASKVGTVSKN